MEEDQWRDRDMAAGKNGGEIKVKRIGEQGKEKRKSQDTYVGKTLLAFRHNLWFTVMISSARISTSIVFQLFLQSITYDLYLGIIIVA